MAEWSTAFVNNLPDSSFAYIEPGGSKDSDGKTTPRSKRHLPYKDASGKVDAAHARNALARLDQTQGIPDGTKTRIKSMLQSALSRTDQGDHHIYEVPLTDVPTETIELSDGAKRYVKQIVKFGKWVDPFSPRKKMVLDRAWAEQVVKNFNSKIVGRIAVPFGHPQSATDLALHNKGELVGLEIRDDGLYGQLDIRDPKAAEAIDNDLIWDVSISFENDYLDKASGQYVGPALLHVGLLTDPYLKGMKPFQALANSTNPIMLSESKENDDMAFLQVKNDRDFDVTVKYTLDGEEREMIMAPGQEVEIPEEVAEDARKQVADATKPEVADPAADKGDSKPPQDNKDMSDSDNASDTDKADGSDHATDDKTEGAESETERLARENAELRDQLAEREAKDSYNRLLQDGRIVPAQKDTFMALATARTGSQVSLSDGTTKSLSDMLTDLLQAGPKRIRFGEDGSSDDEPAKTPWDDLSTEEQEASARLGVGKDEYNKVNSEATTV